MGKGCGIDQNKISVSACLMDSINQEVLCVGLQMAKRDVCGGCLLLQTFNYIVERSAAVGFRLTRP
jgi:hypothetical protein